MGAIMPTIMVTTIGNAIRIVFDTAAGFILHMDGSLLLRRNQFNGKRLDDRHQGHIGIGGHRDGSIYFECRI